MAGSGFVRAGSGMALNKDQALFELAKAARELLIEVAGTYRECRCAIGIVDDYSRQNCVK